MPAAPATPTTSAPAPTTAPAAFAPEANAPTDPHDLIVVGAGFAGLYTAIHARERGYRVLGIEAAPEVGGTWFWNRYPGARCDVESVDYSFSFDPALERDWRWSERYATQPEILRYLQFVADRHSVRPLFRFGERVSAAHWDEAAQQWEVRTDAGRTERARFLVMATGALSAPILPDIAGRDSFTGEVYQTAAWPAEEPDLRGKRVAVIGTGSSGIQAVPLLAAQAASLTVFQRTPNYSVPAFNRPIDDAEWATLQEGLAERRRISWASPAGSPWSAHPVPYEELSEAERQAVLSESWQRGGVLFSKAFQGQLNDLEVNDAAREFFTARLAERIDNPAVFDDLLPKNQPLGVKRICTDSGYYETFNQPHVSLVNLRRHPITAITPTGITTDLGTEVFDVIVYATGFDAMTGALTSIDLVGRDGVLLREAWAGGHLTLLGVGIPGFPNLLALNGPGSPSVFANMALTSEQQGAFALDLIDYTLQHGYTSVDTREDAAQGWIDTVQELAAGTLFAGAESWYTGANIAGKPSTFLPYPGGFNTYNAVAADIAERGYAGFVFCEQRAELAA